MDARITKKRLSQLLSYDWLKIIGFVVVAIIVWSLIFTMTATRITAAQQFTVMNYKGSTLTGKFSERYYQTFKDGVFSHEVIELTTVDTTTGGDDMVNTLLDTRLQTDEGDLLFAAHAKNPSASYTVEGSDEKQYYTYLETFLRGYYIYALSLEDTLDAEGNVAQKGFITRMTEYVNGYYGGDYQTGELDKEKVEKDFKKRIKKNDDKRFQSDGEIKKGIEKEYERLEKYRDGLIKFLSYLDKGYIALQKNEVKITETYTRSITTLNMCPNEETMGQLKEEVYYADERSANDSNDPEKTVFVSTALNMNLVFLTTAGMEKQFQYETILYVNSLVERYCTELQPAEGA
ncbi:MAG: hypothetical protein IJ506_03240 [Clostridia bacterium]|nr:hypothetical protein [Clostridia bacterium]